MSLDTLEREATVERAPLLDELAITRALTEADHFNRLRQPDGSHNPFVEEALLENAIPAVKEGGMPSAVSTVYQVRRDDNFWWLDQTAEDVSASGHGYHEHPIVLDRVEIEVDETADVCDNLQPGNIKVFASPRLTRAETSLEVAEREHLAHEDMVRIHWLDVSETGEVVGKYMQSVLVRGIPLPAWNALLADQTLFETSIIVSDPSASRSVMEAHREMHVPAHRLPNGVTDVIAAILPHVRWLDPEAAESVEAQLNLLTLDQEALHAHATAIAKRSVEFDKQLADSLHSGLATEPVKRFIESVLSECSDKFRLLLEQQTMFDGIMMTRELAAYVKLMRQNTLLVSAAVVSGNQAVIDQMPVGVSQQIYMNELYLQHLAMQGARDNDIQNFEDGNNKIIAQENVKVGAGCPGILENLFKGWSGGVGSESKEGKTEVMTCVTCPLCGKEGVTATIKHEKKQKTITCSKCKGSKIYKK